MTRRSDQRPPPKDYEVGYGKPPVSGRFVKGVSGNPRGRPKTVRPAPPPPDTSARDRFLAEADRMITVTEGGVQTQMPVAGAVLRAETVAALKGNALAQRNFIEREERHRAERAAEIAESHAFWRDYVAKYSLPGKEIPKGFPHPEDVVIQPGKHVWFRGGDPEEAEKHWATLRRWRDAFLVQAEIDYRHHARHMASEHDHRIPQSEVLMLMMNHLLPNRYKLDEATDVRLRMKYMRMTKTALIAERRKILDFLPRRNETKFTTKITSKEKVTKELRKIRKRLWLSY
jgi:hypothetical protein